MLSWPGKLEKRSSPRQLDPAPFVIHTEAQILPQVQTEARRTAGNQIRSLKAQTELGALSATGRVTRRRLATIRRSRTGSRRSCSPVQTGPPGLITQEKPTAGSSTSADVVRQSEADHHAPRDCTPAHCGAQTVMERNTARLFQYECDFRTIFTPLDYEKWEAMLNKYNLVMKYPDIPTSIRSGFYMGVDSTIPKTCIPTNHKSALENPEAVDAHIRKEMREGRYVGPFAPDRLEALIGPFRTSPLGVVPKPGTDGFRIPQDLSFPRDDPDRSSVNDEIDGDDFLCSWGTFNVIAEMICTNPPEMEEAATFAVDAAYRR